MKKPARERAKGILASLCFLSPAIESYNHWIGKEVAESEFFPAVLMLAATRAIELIVESVPESILQMKVAFSDVNDVSFVMAFSIVSSLVSASAIMADTNISFELGRMNGQTRGRCSHHTYGLIPSRKRNLAALYLGTFLFHIGYLATAEIVATSCILHGFSATSLICYMHVEFAFIYAYLYSTGRKHAIAGINYLHGLGTWHIVMLMQNFIPFINCRLISVFGGRMFASWIVWRLFSNTAAFVFVMLAWAGEETAEAVGSSTNTTVVEFLNATLNQDAVAADDDAPVRVSVIVMVAAYSVALISSILGIILIFMNVEKSHRNTLYKDTHESALAANMEAFLGVPLIKGHQTRDGQALDAFIGSHASYFEHDAVKMWMLSLNVGNPLFADDEVFPADAGDQANNSYSHFFEVSLKQYTFYGDVAGNAEITAHFEKLTVDINERNAARKQASLERAAEEGGGNNVRKEEEEQEDADEMSFTELLQKLAHCESESESLRQRLATCERLLADEKQRSREREEYWQEREREWIAAAASKDKTT
jgi:hypothetical protein